MTVEKEESLSSEIKFQNYFNILNNIINDSQQKNIFYPINHHFFIEFISIPPKLPWN